MTVARGRPDRTRRRSTRSVVMPWRARLIAAVRPAGPAPATSTGTSRVRMRALLRRTVCLSVDRVSSRRRCVNRNVSWLTVATRRYEQRLRAEAAAETRRRILDAVYDRLREAPTQPVSIDQVARAARVARSTIYLIFGSRAGLFDAVGRDLMERGRFDRVVDAIAHPDAHETLRRGIRASCEYFAAHRDVHRVLVSTAALDAEATAGAVQRSEARRTAGMADLARRLAEQDRLRPHVTAEDAAHLLYLITSFDAFDVLYTGRGLPVDEVARLLVATAERTICR
jgi:AcrR family transcriptional regulator